ncbi:MAG: HAMP domain-containing protein, partial [Patescibacteria group bacterium]
MTTLLIFSLTFIFSEKNKLSEDIVNSGLIFANFSTKTIYDNYVQYYTHPRPEDFENFKKNIEEVLTNNPDVVGVTLVGINGRILFDSKELKEGKHEGEIRTISDDWTRQAVKEGRTDYRSIAENGEKFTEIIVPISQNQGHFFSLRYLLSRSSLAERMKEVYAQIFFAVIPLLIISIAITFFFTVRLIRPIKNLTEAAGKVRQGSFDINVAVESKDEIGQLAVAFNDMSVKLKESYSILEAKVKERTKELEKERKSLDSRVQERTKELEKLKNDLEATVKERTATLQEKLTELERMNKHMIGRELKMAEL